MALICDIVEADTHALPASSAVLALAARMGQGMGTENRFALAERMRDCADMLERETMMMVKS